LRFGHRTRLTVIATGTSGLILFAALRTAMIGFNRTEIQAAGDVLLPELRQAQEELRENPANPDLQEIVAADPSVSVAVFDRDGKLKFSAGRVGLRALSGFGKVRFGRVKEVYQGVRGADGTIVVASPWGNRDAMVDRVAQYGLFLWLGSTLCVAAVSWFATKAAFTPLERLAREAETLSGNNLAGRLSLADRGEYASFVLTLNRFLDRIESAVRREERFVSDAAHELRTPLTILRGRIETTLARSRTPEAYRETLITVLDETERLSRMVELLLQSGAPASEQVSPVDLEQEVERVHARWVDRFHARGVRLELSSKPAHASILPSEFDVVVDNLLANALNASSEGTRCFLRSEPFDSVARIEVRDQGIGIPLESRETIFERLTRLDPGRNRNVGGFGIGLAVCRRLVESRGGTIYVAPTEEGALFVVELPLAG
jgi:signal transduction histidine kinase